MLKDRTEPNAECINSSYNDCQIAIFGIPYDGTVSYRPGTRFGPNAIRNEMYGLETYSPYLNKDLADYNICDLGDMELPFGNTELVLESIGNETKSILDDDKKIVALGGEHLVSYPIIEQFYKKHNDLIVIHFDAHADLREEYLGERLSHASTIKRVHDFLGEEKIYQFGIRSGTKEEFEFAKEHTNIHLFDLKNISSIKEEILNNPVYLTIDLDVLDPSIFPGTGTPEAGGVSFNELMTALKTLDTLNIVGADIVELAPHYDTSGVSTAVACKVLRELLLIMV